MGRFSETNDRFSNHCNQGEPSSYGARHAGDGPYAGCLDGYHFVPSVTGLDVKRPGDSGLR